MNVLVVDDEPIIRQGLRELVDWEMHGFTYAGDAEDGLEACGLLEDIEYRHRDNRPHYAANGWLSCLYVSLKIVQDQ